MGRNRGLHSLVAGMSGLVLIGAGSASAIPAHGTFVDATCTSNEFVPARPFNPNGANPNDPTQVACGLCHANASSPNGALNAGGDQFRRSGHNDVSPFCAPPVVNRPPIFGAIPFQLATAGFMLELMVTARDPEGGPVLLSASNAPVGSSFADAGDGTGMFRWRPSGNDLGAHSVRFHAADTGSPMAVRTLDVFISVGPAANLPPVLAPIGNLQVEVGDTLAFTLAAEDPEGQALAFSATGLPSGASLVNAAFSFTPDAGQMGPHPVTFTVTDDGDPIESASETVVITVGRGNRPPVLAPIGDREVAVGSELRAVLTASDPDGDAINFACSGLPADGVLDDRGDGSAELVWLPRSATRTTVACAATDTGSPPASAVESFALVATEPAPDPDADAPVLTDALWKREPWGGKLRVVGHHPKVDSSAPRESSRAPHGHARRDASRGPRGGESIPAVKLDVYGLLDDGTPVLLGARMTSARAVGFRIELEPFIAPCEVAVASGEAMSAARIVRSAPASCGEELLTRVSARIGCEGRCLRIEGRRAPIGGVVRVRDADSQGAWTTLPVQSELGRFRGRIEIDGRPRALAVEVEQGGRTWTLAEPVRVRVPGERCDEWGED